MDIIEEWEEFDTEDTFHDNADDHHAPYPDDGSLDNITFRVRFQVQFYMYWFHGVWLNVTFLTSYDGQYGVELVQCGSLRSSVVCCNCNIVRPNEYNFSLVNDFSFGVVKWV